MNRYAISSVVGLALVVGAAVTGSAATIQPGENVQDELQEALILVDEGGVIELGEGVFDFVGSLSLDVDGVTVRGQGMDKTILSFKNQDAGIYVGQSRNVIVRNSTAKYNVAGIEIENCYNADVYNNLATHNTGGILIFDMPNLPQQGGHNVRVFNNKSVDNDTPNFAPPGNIVGTVPTGSGLIIMANRNVEVFDNEFSGNGTFNISVTAYMAGPDEKVDPNYYPYPEALYIHDNPFGTGGYKPMGILGMLAVQAAKSPTLGDIMWDGRTNPEKTKDGKLPESDWIYIKESADTEFINIDLGTFMTDPEASNPSRDISAHQGELPRLPAVKLPQDMENTD